MKGGGHLYADSDNNGDIDDEETEQRGNRKGKWEEKESMKKSGECTQLKRRT